MKKATRIHLAETAKSKALVPFHGEVDGLKSNLKPIVRLFPMWNTEEAEGLWCAAFVYYCCREAGFDIPYRPEECRSCHLAGCLGWEELALSDPRIECHKADEGFVPKEGDIVIYDRVFEDREHDHMGIVLEEREHTLLVAEGNVDNRSAIIERPIDEHIRCYIRIPDGYQYGTGNVSQNNPQDRRILFIGGAPCSGKSTVAEMLAEEAGAYYFKVDNYLEEFVDRAAREGKKTCLKYKGLSSDEIWLRNPEEQCRDEFLIYDEMAPYAFEKLEQINEDLIITEGAAYTPEVMKEHGFTEYIAIVPTPEFQIEHYRQRQWVRHVLADCSDKETAFDNWMKRDILFAQQVRRECEEQGIVCLVNDGSMTVQDMYEQVKASFGL